MEFIVAIIGGISMFISLSIVTESNFIYVIIGQLLIVGILIYLHDRQLRNKVKSGY